MPAPFLFWAAAAWGAKKLIDADDNRTRARRINEEAAEIAKAAKNRMERSHEKLKKTLIELIETKEYVVNGNISEIVDMMEKLFTEVERANDTEKLLELERGGITKVGIREMREMSDKVKEISSVSIDFRKIGNSNGGLATLGALGGAALGLGTIAAPLLLMYGFMKSDEAKAALYEAETALDSANNYDERSKSICAYFDALDNRSRQLDQLLINLNGYLDTAKDQMIRVVNKKGSDLDSYSSEEEAILFVTWQIANTCQIIVETSILNEEGTLSVEVSRALDTGYSAIDLLSDNSDAIEYETEELPNMNSELMTINSNGVEEDSDPEDEAENLYWQGRDQWDDYDYEESFKCYKKAAQLGHVDSMLETGAMLYKGYGVDEDFIQAFSWLNEAAKRGNVKAMIWTGRLYRDGEGIVQNSEKAIEWFERALDEGDSEGGLNIALMYDRGTGIPVDKEKAAEWYRRAADAGNATAMNNLGYAFDNGQGVAKDSEQAIYWYEQAAENGIVTAMTNLGYFFWERRNSDWTENVGKALNWYRKAANEGNTSAMKWSGYIWGTGIGDDDSDKAMYWYKKALENGMDAKEVAVSMNNVGTWHYNKSNYKNSIYWYKKAIELDPNNEQYKKNLKTAEDKVCFITTAVCGSFGKPDDCEELTAFRKFRDNWLIQQPDGKSLITEYYAIAPQIVEKINALSDSATIYKNLWRDYLADCFKFIKDGDNQRCKKVYTDMVTLLKEKFLSKN